jgi:hypothetical protein
MTKTVVGSFDTFEHARDMVAALGGMGVRHEDVNLVANDAAGRLAAGRAAAGGTATSADGTVSGAGTGHDTDSSEGGDMADSTAASAGRGAVAGGVIGGAAGLIAGLAGLAVPGIGPLVAAGPIAAALAGAGIGAVAGGLIGGLRHVGVSDTDAEYYAEAVRRGGALLIVRADDTRAEGIADAMRRHGAIDIESRVAAWRKSGWSGFDANAQPYSHDEIERERLAHRTGAGVPVAVLRTDDVDLRSGSMGGAPVAPGTRIGSDLRPRLGAATVGGSTVPTGPGMDGTVAGRTVGGAARSTEHPSLGAGSDRPGVDTRASEPVRTDRAGMSGSQTGATGPSVRDAARRAGDAIERGLPGDADGDGR